MNTSKKLTKKKSDEIVASENSCVENSSPKPKIEKFHILFVCTGNTCRSPMAEYIMKYVLSNMGKLKLYSVASAGLNVNAGELMADNAVEALSEMGIHCKPRKARQLTEKSLQKADLVVCMSQSHKRMLKDYAKKTVTIADITGAHDVNDPYGQSIEIYKMVAEYLTYASSDILEYCEKLGKL